MILTLAGVWIIFINYIKYIFMHMKKGWLFAGITIIFLIIGIVFYFGAYKRNDYSLNAVKYCYGVLKDKFYGVYVRVFMDKNNRYLDVNEVLVKLMIKEGENIEKNIGVRNLGFDSLFVRVDDTLQDVVLDRSEFELFDQANIKLNFTGTSKGVYVGRLNFRVNDDEIYLPLIFEVETKNVDFDVNIDVAPEYTISEPGEQVILTVRLFNLIGEKRNVDVEYSLVDTDGISYYSEKESLIVGEDIGYDKSLMLPENLHYGEYVFVVKVTYEDSLGVGTYLLYVDRDDQRDTYYDVIKENWMNLVVLFILLVFVVLVIFSYRRSLV